MVKNSRRVVLLLVMSVLFLGGEALAQDKKKVKNVTLVLGGQNAKASYGGFGDLNEGNVYTINEASLNQENVDIVYAYGTKTNINLMTPSSSGMGYFGKRYKEQVADKWNTKNRGTFVVLSNNKDARKLYKGIKTNEQLTEAYSKAVQEVMLRDDYVKNNHGPLARVRNIQIGDYILFRSRSANRGVYAIGRIVNFNSGYQGDVTIDWKVASK